jgi:class 3 adenylate cyclase/uncharacterized protein HemY
MLPAALLLLPAVFFAQTEPAESLLRELKTAPPDTHRVSLLVDYSWEINETQTNQADSMLQEAVALARRLGYAKGEAAAINSLGVVAEIRGNYTEAENFYKQALRIRRGLGDLREIGATLNNLGIVYDYQGRFDSALSVYRENLGIQRLLADTLKVARAHFNMAAAQQEMGLYPEAQSDLLSARSVFESRGDRDGTAKVYTQLGHLFFEMERYDSAFAWYQRALALREKLDDPGRHAEALSDYANALDELDSSKTALIYYQQALELWKQLDDLPGQAQVYINMGDAYKHTGEYATALRYLQMAEKICLELEDDQGLMEVFNTIGDVHYRAKRLQLALEYTQKYHEIAVKAGDEKYIQSAYKDFAEVYAEMGDFEEAYKWRVQYDELKYERMNLRIGVAFARKEELFADQRRQEEIERQRQELRIRDAELASAQTRQIALAGGAVALLLLAGLLFNRNRIRALANRELAAKNQAIQRERERADNLLKNILPEKTAEELKLHNRVQPVRYESVTVMFTDFKGFTLIAEKATPEALIEDLDECFRLFDAVVEKYGLEKIKTLGDAYMCAGGLPTPNDTHPVDMVSAALEMLERLSELQQRRMEKGKPVFEMRVGIHTGPVVAGVVGSHKFAYDIWGDTVNIAARLEQGGEPGRINISETTYQQVKHRFDCAFRGKLAAKNKGEIEMYFVTGRRSILV